MNDDTAVCLRCGRKASFGPDDDDDIVSDCCGWPAVAPDRFPEIEDNELLYELERHDPMIIDVDRWPDR